MTAEFLGGAHSPEDEEDCANIYLFLARAFSRPPDGDLMEASRALPLVPQEAGWDQVEQAIRGVSAAARESSSLGALKGDYQRLFVGPGRLPAPPWESVYRSPERLVFQQPMLEVRRCYLEAGFTHQAMFVEPDDHIALELEFLGLLCQQRAEALRRHDSPRAEDRLRHRAGFLREHLVQWVGAFSEDVEKAASTPFWRAVASLLRAFTRCDAERTLLGERAG